MNALDDIVNRAIHYTNGVLARMPSYREVAIAGLRKLRAALARDGADGSALVRLDSYLESLDDKAARGESALTRSERLL